MSQLFTTEKVETIKNAPKVRIKTENLQEKDLWVNGLKKIITHNNRDGYEIGTYKCVKCGQEISVNKPLLGFDKWCACGGRLDLKDKMKRSQVEEIVSRQVAYACPKCGKIYRWPTDCCLAQGKLTPGEVFEFNIRRPRWPKLIAS